MKKIIAAVLVLAIVCCFVGCKNNKDGLSENENGYQADGNSSKSDCFSDNGSSNADENSLNSNNSLSNIKTENVKINSLDKLNFYAVKKAIAEKEVTVLAHSQQAPGITTLSNNGGFRITNLVSTTSKNINANSTFTITMCSYFAVTISDARGFLAQKLGGTGSVEVVITRNNFNNMITFRKGDRYYSCLQTSSTENAMSFSTHKYVSGFKLVENYEQENYEFTVYFEGDKVTGINCGRFKTDDGNFKYVADDIEYNDNLCFVVHKTQSFTAEQLESMFSSNNSFVDDGVVLKDGPVLYGESSVTNNSVAFKNGSGSTVITNKDIKKISALYNSKYGFCIRLYLVSSNKISGKVYLNFYLNNSSVRTLTLQKDGNAVYITDLDNKSRMSDIFYKLTAINTSNRIGKIIDREDFVKEMSKKINLDGYNFSKEDYSSSFGEGLKIINYTYDLKTDKSISYKASNYDVTIDGVTFTMPIKVSDFISLGFTVSENNFDDNYLSGGPVFKSKKGNKVLAYVMDFYGNSANFNNCYITQISVMCYEETVKYQEGISPTRPDFEMLEGINKDSTLDDIISRLGEPNKIILYTTDNQNMNYKDSIIQLYYDVSTPSLPNGKLVFNIKPVLNGNAPSDFLTDISFALQ